MDTGKPSGTGGKEDPNRQMYASQKVEEDETKPRQLDVTSSSGSIKSAENEGLKSVSCPVILVDYGSLPAEPPIGKWPVILELI